MIRDTAARAEDASAALAAAAAAAASGIRLKSLVADHGAKLRALSLLTARREPQTLGDASKVCVGVLPLGGAGLCVRMCIRMYVRMCMG